MKRILRIFGACAISVALLAPAGVLATGAHAAAASPNVVMQPPIIVVGGCAPSPYAHAPLPGSGMNCGSPCAPTTTSVSRRTATGVSYGANCGGTRCTPSPYAHAPLPGSGLSCSSQCSTTAAGTGNRTATGSSYGANCGGTRCTPSPYAHAPLPGGGTRCAPVPAAYSPGRMMPMGAGA